MGAGKGKTKRAQTTPVDSGGEAPLIFDIKRAVESEKTGLAEEIVRTFREQANGNSKMTAIIKDEEDGDAGVYTLTCSALDGIDVTNMLVDGRWNMGAHFTLRENGT